MSSTTPDSTPHPDGHRQELPTRRGFKRWIFLALVLLGLLGLGDIWNRGSRVDDRLPTAEDLSTGPVSQIISWENGRTAVQISRWSNLLADDLWRVATDQARFDEFMPYVRSTTVRPGPDETLVETQILDLPHASYDLELTIQLLEEGDRRTARWQQSKGILPYNEGAWVVERANNGAILRYQVSASLTGVPQWIVNYAMLRRLGRLLEAVEARVRDLQQKEPDYFRS